ncbi:MAG TPA: multicopper oxidase domain-containing protein, partial [Gemmatimonadales bacterium]|nr:multicopper oxidase domain-containing protein [Gemmatimonadales bacterium]
MPARPEAALSRRRFLHLAAAGAAAAAGGGMVVLSSCGEPTGPGPGGWSRSPLGAPTTVPASGASLVPAPGIATIGIGASSPAWLFNGVLPGPTLRARRDEQARIRLINGLPEPTIVHWHGLLVPEEADGHPRYAIGPGETYDYVFPLVQRAGTFWYHPHPHHRTAGQIHRGLAGFFLVTDDKEDALGLPAGPREILLVLQDREGDPDLAFQYAPTGADLHTGMLRDVSYGNGIRLPTLAVSGARYRFRVLNASQARVYRLALADGAPLTVIGNDGGLLPAPTEVDSVYLGIGERVDLLVDFAGHAPGTRLMLGSLPFSLPSAPGGGTPQGAAMDLLELVRGPGPAESAPPLPGVLSPVPSLGTPLAERTFLLRSTAHGDLHQINGRSFDMDRVDERIPLGQVERWV